MTYPLITLNCLLLAAACYAFFGLAEGSVLFLGLGVAMETMTLVRILRRPRLGG